MNDTDINQFINELLKAMTEDACEAKSFCDEVVRDFEYEHKVEVQNLEYKGIKLSIQIDDKWYNFEMNFKKI